MEFEDVVKNLEHSEQFKEWKKEHAKTYLAHVFVMIEQDAAVGYQVGYFDTTDQKMTSFLVAGDRIEALPPSEVFKEPGAEVLGLEVKGISFSTEDVLTKAHEVRVEDYGKIPAIKTFFILQNINDLGTVFNVTFVTQDLNTLNIKLDAHSGEVLKHSVASLVSREPGLAQ